MCGARVRLETSSVNCNNECVWCWGALAEASQLHNTWGEGRGEPSLVAGWINGLTQGRYAGNTQTHTAAQAARIKAVDVHNEVHMCIIRNSQAAPPLGSRPCVHWMAARGVRAGCHPGNSQHPPAITRGHHRGSWGPPHLRTRCPAATPCTQQASVPAMSSHHDAPG